MNRALNILILVFFLFLNSVFSQSFKLNQISLRDFEIVQDSLNQVPAIVLERNVKVDVSNSVEVYEKIKILNKDGLDFATIDFPYYNVIKVKGFTHNLQNEEIISSKLTSEMIFTDKVKLSSETFKDQKAAFPKVEVGSVIEIYYKSTIGTFSDILIQYDIPIKRLAVEIDNSSFANFSVVQNPLASLSLNIQNKRNKIFVYAGDIPPLVNAPYVFDIEQYRAKLIFKQTGNVFSKQSITEWGDIAKILSKNERFIEKVTPIYDDKIRAITKDANNPLATSKIVYNYIKDQLEWNNKIGYFPVRDNKTTLINKTGNVADINLLLVSFLRSVGVQSYPILASTKMNGIQSNPSIESFDYLVAGVKIMDNWYVLDAAYPQATFDYYPEFLINWKGMIVLDDGRYEWINLTDTKKSKRIVMSTINLSANLEANGEIKERRSGYFGVHLNNLIKDNIELSKEILLDYSGLDLSLKNIKLEGVDETLTSDIIYQFNFESALEKIGDEYYLSPLLFFKFDENPFKSETREIPTDFGFSQSTEYVLTLEIPKDFTISYIPEPANIVMPNDIGVYYYKVVQLNNLLKVFVKFEINTPLIDSDFYIALKDFLSLRVAKENETVILKRNSD